MLPEELSDRLRTFAAGTGRVVVAHPPRAETTGGHGTHSQWGEVGACLATEARDDVDDSPFSRAAEDGQLEERGHQAPSARKTATSKSEVRSYGPIFKDHMNPFMCRRTSSGTGKGTPSWADCLTISCHLRPKVFATRSVIFTLFPISTKRSCINNFRVLGAMQTS
jgi:hypothetical protein